MLLSALHPQSNKLHDTTILVDKDNQFEETASKEYDNC